MTTTSPQSPRLTRFAVLAVSGATALSIAACTSSNKSTPTSTVTSTSTSTSTETSTTGAPPPAGGEAHVSGMVASVAGSAIQVTQADDSNATVDFTPTTKITELTPAALTDVKPGSCVTARPANAEGQPGQPVTAASVRLSPAVDGKCPQAPAPAAAAPPPPPPPPGAPAPPPAPPGPANPAPIRGSVASVADNTINITTNDVAGNPVQTAVTVNDETKYSKKTDATSDAIKQGKCIKAKGAKDPAGTLQATTIKLQEPVDNKCPGQGG